MRRCGGGGFTIHEFYNYLVKLMLAPASEGAAPRREVRTGMPQLDEIDGFIWAFGVAHTDED